MLREEDGMEMNKKEGNREGGKRDKKVKVEEEMEDALEQEVERPVSQGVVGMVMCPALGTVSGLGTASSLSLSVQATCSRNRHYYTSSWSYETAH